MFYRPQTELPPMSIYQLVRTSETDKMGSLGGKPHNSWGPYILLLRNVPISTLIDYLNQHYYPDRIHIEDATGFTEPVDIILHTRLETMAHARKALQVYDLDLVPQPATKEDDSMLHDHQKPCLT
ncbi:hypothetical protein [Fulvivirga ligni]|uniref:hypothetical protein n=1 Tax=Fulvivirga ligni TaxID=2904246 RepID=UPI001F4011C8|nr:hypothetical protein [Fulvivirga ligni]UII20855.1 hypothetical protein LVD16_23725 [Fulvivirga ligni]